MDRLRVSYNILKEVFQSGAYASIALNDALRNVSDARDRAYITKLVYGVIEDSIAGDYIIGKICAKSPKPAVKIILKIGLYCIRRMNTPMHAAVNSAVELTRAVGKPDLRGFVNATLRKAAGVELPKRDEVPLNRYLSLTYGYPLWAVDMLTADYGEEFAEALISHKGDNLTHIRPNLSVTDKLNIEGARESGLGYYVTHDAIKKLNPAHYLVQSYASMQVCRAADGENPKRILDLCSAPGGKSVYLAQLYPQAEVTACDIHPHRLELIKSYAERGGVKLDIKLNDATIRQEKWIGQFDLVLCDVPCSGLGVAGQKPDILLNRAPEDVDKLAAVQKTIFDTAAQYVKPNGIIIYSTCTVLKKENEQIIDSFLQSNNNFISEKTINLFPHTHGTDGFFIAKLRLKK